MSGATGPPQRQNPAAPDLLERLRLLSAALDAVGNTISITNRAGVLEWVNPAFTTLTGYTLEEVVGHTPAVLQSGTQDASTYSELWKTILAGQIWRGELLNRRKDGTLYRHELTITPVQDERGEITHFVGVSQDVTERKRLEEQFRQAQKMEAVGRLAGGVAHDFNNLLTAIRGYTDLILIEGGPDNPYREDLQEILKASERAAGLTRQLLAFSRQEVIQPRPLDLNMVVNDVSKMLRRLIGEDIQLTSRLAAELHSVSADPGQIEQVLLNLAVNARDAMPQGGSLTIETGDIELDSTFARTHYPFKPGSYVVMVVSDTGTGMTTATKAHLFEPFFTTKERGRGTGLGLAMVYGIVKQNGGFIWVYSEPGQGATFKIYLPQIAEAADALPAPPAAGASLMGSETILLVEDEAAVRTMTRRVLEHYGYTVLEATNAEAAFAFLARYHGPIQLLLTDIVMPGMSGPELATKLVSERSGLRVLYMSGYTDDAVVRRGTLPKGVAYLQKPFTSDILGRKVKEVLSPSH